MRRTFGKKRDELMKELKADVGVIVPAIYAHPDLPLSHRRRYNDTFAMEMEI